MSDPLSRELSNDIPNGVPNDAPLRYGRRQIMTQNQTAQPVYQTVALTPEDFLNPQPGDEFFHGEQHDRDVRRLTGLLRHHYRYSPLISVLSGVKLIWPDAQLAQPAPDVALVNELPDPQRHRPLLDLAAEGVTLRAVIEVVSPLFAEQDRVAKRALYAQAGVGETWLIDAGLRSNLNPDQRPDQPHYTITGLRLEGDHYVEIAPDGSGRLTSPACRIWFQATADPQGWTIGDARTGAALIAPPDLDEPPTAAQVEATWRAESIASKLNFLH